MIDEAKAQSIRALVLDVDGVLTDGSIWVGAQGETMKRFNVKDGLGIKLLQAAGIEVAIITGRQSEIVNARAKELGITHVYQGQRHKLAAFNAFLETCQLKPEEVACMGDDLPDLPLMAVAGLAVCPHDAVAEVIHTAHWRTQAKGGQGAVRELAEAILKARRIWLDVIRPYTQKSAL